jgi:hypothetical protein
MTRRRAVAALFLVVGGIVGLSLSTISAGTTNAPALYTQVSAGNRTLDIWRAGGTGDLTFHWDDANASVAVRFVPKRLIVAELNGGRALSVTPYRSSAAAWTRIRGLFGVTQQQVRSDLLAGSPSDAAPTAGVRLPRTTR